MRSSTKFTTLFLGVAMALGALVPASDAVASPDAPVTVAEAVAAVERTYKSATSIRADFLQVDKSTAMGTETRKRGRLSLERPRKMRIEMGMPLEQAFVSNGKTIWTYSVKERQVLELPELTDGEGMGVLLEDLGRIGEIFDVTLVPEKPPGKPSYTVQLKPKKPGAYKSLELTFSKQKHVLQDLVLVSQMDDVTQMSFTMVKLNGDIPDAEFNFVPPAGVKIVKPGVP